MCSEGIATPPTVPPAVSILMPTFNRLEFVPPAVESVLAQSFTDWELIIADDGSDPDTKNYLQSLQHPRVRVLFMAHTGMSRWSMAFRFTR